MANTFRFRAPSLPRRTYGRYLEVAPTLAALGAADAPQQVLPKTSAAGGAAGRVAVQRGAPITAAATSEERAVVAAAPANAGGGFGTPGWVASIGLPPSALSRLPAVFQSRQVYAPVTMPGGVTLNPTESRMTAAQLATIGSPGTGTGLGGITDFIRSVGRAIDPTNPNSVVGRVVQGSTQPQPVPQPVTPGGGAAIFYPQDQTQQYLLYGAIGLAGVLLFMQLRK